MNPATAPASLDEPTQPAATAPVAKPRVWTVFATWLLGSLVGALSILFAFAFAGMSIGVVMGAQGSDSAAIQTRVQELLQQPVLALLLSLVPFQFGMLSVTLFAAWRSKEPLKERLGLVAPANNEFSGLRLAGLASFTASTALATIIATSLLIGAPPADTPVAGVINQSSWWALTLVSLLVSILPALVEEIIFRGYIQRRLLQRWSPTTAIAVTAVLFAVLHADSLQHVIAVIPLATVLGLLAYRTQSIKAGMIVHAIHNTAAMSLGAIAGALTPQLGEEGAGLFLLGAIVALGILGLPAAIGLVRNRTARAAEPQPFELPLPQLLSDSSLARPAV